MGVCKRVLGMLMDKEPVPQPIQALVGLVPWRDPEAWKEKKRLERELNQAEREARAEREAIQWASRQDEKEWNRNEKRYAAPANAADVEQQVSLANLVNDLASESALGRELPKLAAAGWYRLGRDFYRLGQGPCPWFGTGTTEQLEKPAGSMVQRLLF